MKTSQSAGGFIVNDGENKNVLLVEHMDNTWVFPKGHIEEGESAEEAAVREVKEETGLSVRVERYLGDIVRGTKNPDGSISDKRSIKMFLMIIDERTPQIDHEENYDWFSFAEAIKLMRYEADKAFLEENKGLLQ